MRPQCVAHRLGIESEIPGKVKKIKYESRTEYAFVIRNQPPLSSTHAPRYLMRPIPEKLRWAGLWDFPRTIDRSIDDVNEAAKDISKALGAHVKSGEEFTKIRHAVTKYRIELRAHHAAIVGDCDDNTFAMPWRFVSVKEMRELPLSVTGRKIANLLANSES